MIRIRVCIEVVSVQCWHGSRQLLEFQFEDSWSGVELPHLRFFKRCV
jgi:hypothetical protein